MKAILRFLALVICLSGWAVVALCIYVVRVPNPANPQESKFVVVPKNRLGLEETYVDARSWKLQDVKTHPLVALRLLRAGKAEDLKYLADPRSSKDVEAQITDCLDGRSPATEPAPRSASTSRNSIFGPGRVR